MKLNQKSRGLGDTIEKFTTATGIKNVVTKVTKAAGVNDCGCGQRKTNQPGESASLVSRFGSMGVSPRCNNKLPNSTVWPLERPINLRHARASPASHTLNTLKFIV